MSQKIVLVLILAGLVMAVYGDGVNGGEEEETPAGGEEEETPAGGEEEETPAGGEEEETPTGGEEEAPAGGEEEETPPGGEEEETPAGGEEEETPAGGEEEETPAGGEEEETPAGGEEETPAGGEEEETPAGGEEEETPAGGEEEETPAGGEEEETPAEEPVESQVDVLQDVVSNDGCASQRLCAAQPSNCNPGQNGSCFFTSVKAVGGANFEFTISGESEGYVACTLSRATLGNNDITYICANNGSQVRFFTALLRDGELTPTSLPVQSVRGRVLARKIQCTFTAAPSNSVSSSRRKKRQSSALQFSLSVTTGQFNSTTATFGPPTPRLTTNVVNLAEPNATVINTLNVTTATPMAPTTPTPLATTSRASHQQKHSLTKALLVVVALLAVLAL